MAQLDKMKGNLKVLASNFQAGQISQHLDQWQEITNDREILKMVQGANIDFTETPVQEKPSKQLNFSAEQNQAIDDEIQELLGKGVIKQCEHSEGEYVSAIFVRPKKDNKLRMILNLKNLNQKVEYHHFKMDTLKNAIALVTKNCWFASLDLKDAYYSVHVNESSQQYLKFVWKGQLYKFTAFPNGLACCPRLFTKLLKPVMAYLHRLGFMSTSFIDDTLLVGLSKEECLLNVQQTMYVLQRLGFVIHPEKSVFDPVRTITYLGFVLDSVRMTVTLTKERKQKILQTVLKLIDQHHITVRELAKLIGLAVASFPGVKFGPLYYRHMEDDKIKALKENLGDFDSLVNLSTEAMEEMSWWKENIMESFNDIALPEDPDFTIFSDASLTGWGCYCESGRTGGHWTSEEAEQSINVLELKAALFALRTFASEKKGIHLRLMSDNTTAVACVNKMGTNHSRLCNAVAKDIWLFCKERNIWVSAAYVRGTDNVEADEESRKMNLDAEWQLNPDILQEALNYLNFKPDIDLFASRLNKQCSKFMSYRPDPLALGTNAFDVSWKDRNIYCFPPFSVIARMLQKIIRDKAKGVVVVPDWPSQTWYPMLARLLIKKPVLVSARENLLLMPQNPELKHRMRKSLRLIICTISGEDLESQDFRHKVQTLSVPLGVRELQRPMLQPLLSGEGMQADGILIPFHRL